MSGTNVPGVYDTIVAVAECRKGTVVPFRGVGRMKKEAIVRKVLQTV